MLIIGAGGLAKDILEDLPKHGPLYFYDEFNKTAHTFINGSIILHEENEVKKLFEEVNKDTIKEIVQKEPSGQYSRKIWFLYEWLLQAKLDIPDLDKGNFVFLIDEDLQ